MPTIQQLVRKGRQSKVVKTKANADGSIGLDSSAGNNMQDNFDIENPEDLVTDASSN